MNTGLQYHSAMWRLTSGLAALIAMLALPGVAQINGTRASVTSLGGSPIFPPGPRASVTSLGPQGYTPRFDPHNCCFSFRPKNPSHSGLGGGRYGYGVGVLPLYSMPYYYGYGDVVDPVDNSMEQTYGPAAAQRVDRENQAQQYNDERLNRLEQQMDDMENAPKRTEASASEPPHAVADQPDTVLVFRDGHSVQVKNYAIVGDTIYDLSDGSRHKIAIADLDLTATEKANDARGLDFRLPARPLGY